MSCDACYHVAHAIGRVTRVTSRRPSGRRWQLRSGHQDQGAAAVVLAAVVLIVAVLRLLTTPTMKAPTDAPGGRRPRSLTAGLMPVASR